MAMRSRSLKGQVFLPTDITINVQRKTFDLTFMVHGNIVFNAWTNIKSGTSKYEVNFTS